MVVPNDKQKHDDCSEYAYSGNPVCEFRNRVILGFLVFFCGSLFLSAIANFFSTPFIENSHSYVVGGVCPWRGVLNFAEEILDRDTFKISPAFFIAHFFEVHSLFALLIAANFIAAKSGPKGPPNDACSLGLAKRDPGGTALLGAVRADFADFMISLISLIS
jgi:hypothetical protein